MMFHQHAHAVREVFVWHGVRLQRGAVLTDDDVHELELPENAELLRRCTRIPREAVVAPEAPAVKAFVPYAVPVSAGADAPVKE
jgi:hypothetical protein